MIHQNDVLRLKTLVQEMKSIVDKYDQPPTPGPVEPPAKAITHVVLESLSDKPQEYVPFTFGQVFAVGDFKPGSGLAGRFDNGDTIPLQVDVKALHADGSVRHAIISGIGGALFGKEQRKMELIPAAPDSRKPIGDAAMPNGVVKLVLDGATYSTKAALIKNARDWLAGPDVEEILAKVALTDEKGKEHPHLTLRAAFRLYSTKQARVDLTIENVSAYEPNPQNFSYEAQIEIDGKVRFELKDYDVLVPVDEDEDGNYTKTKSEKRRFTHYHHTRWRKVFWIGEEPKLNIRIDPYYFISTGALANYDLNAKPSEETLQALAKEWTGDKIKPMGIGLAYGHMAGTGGRRDIGLLPGWAVMWLLSQDVRARMVTNGTAELAGSWPVHYRDKDTDQPLSIIDYPYATLPGKSPSDSMNRTLNRQEGLPSLVKGKSDGAPSPESSHQPQFAYLSYLIEGDYYYLEEMQFWAMWNILAINPSAQYRQNIKGLVYNHQVRAQAWSLRSLLDCAYITPDADRLKSHFNQLVDSNLDYYNATYTDNPSANKLGALDNGGAFAYKTGTAIGPWQDDFETSVIGLAAERGFEKAKKFMQWKGKFVVGRMNAEGADWRAAANYNYTIRDDSKSPIYDTFKKASEATIASAKAAPIADDGKLVSVLNASAQVFPGAQESPISYVANMQPALAMAVDVGIPGANEAWEKMMAARKDPKYAPDFTKGPQFAIIPRAK